MPRARNIKPGFFTNEVLAALPALTRLLFVGLWTLADREGRLEDRPGKIKLQVLPNDDTDVDADLGELADAGFINRYTVAGERYIQVVKFLTHQAPHHRETASVIPGPDEAGPSPDPGTTKAGPSPDLGEEIPCQDRLIPDSGYLIPDSPVTTPSGSVPGNKQTHARGRVREGNGGVPEARPVPRRSSQSAIRAALSAACYDGRAPPALTADERVWLGTAAAELAALPDATLDEIARRAAVYTAKWPVMPLTPRALTRNWSKLGTDETPGRTADDDAFLAAFDAALNEPDAPLPPGGGEPRRPAP